MHDNIYQPFLVGIEKHRPRFFYTFYLYDLPHRLPRISSNFLGSLFFPHFPFVLSYTFFSYFISLSSFSTFFSSFFRYCLLTWAAQPTCWTCWLPFNTSLITLEEIEEEKKEEKSIKLSRNLQSRCSSKP